MSVVVDASIALAWLFDDEVTPEIDQLFVSLALRSGYVPEHWRLEVASGFRIAVRRGRAKAEYRSEALAQLAKLPIEIDSETNTHAWHATLRLADRRGLTPYDAAYLELAQRRRLPLATLDRDLANAAEAEGVTVQGR
ncbi:MAG: type II toxin-antitoxin system VapC family toxin [Mesorhizobium sp.]|nr:type II toxin-antitoxin system VapC family toxin [Mesorhizobium sp.]MBN9243832.1 type II toxin-antitoxin system VapC family toxin [Mesorhizobium sp.]